MTNALVTSRTHFPNISLIPKGLGAGEMTNALTSRTHFPNISLFPKGLGR